MELRHLRYFLMIAQTENIRRASQKLDVTQPAITRQLQNLEEELGVNLFDRLPRGLRLSAAGRAYREDASRIMTAVEAAGERALRVAAGEIGQLKIGYIETAAWKGVVPETFQSFSSTNPSIRLELLAANTDRQYDLIDSGEIDGGFLYPLNDPPAYCETFPIRKGNVVLAIPSRWSARFGPSIELHKLEDVPFVACRREGHCAYQDRLTAKTDTTPLTPKVTQLAQNEGAVLSLVAAGLGVAIVNDANADRPPAGVSFLPFSDYSVPLILHFTYRSDNDNPVLCAFLRTVRAYATAAPRPEIDARRVRTDAEE